MLRAPEVDKEEAVDLRNTLATHEEEIGRWNKETEHDGVGDIFDLVEEAIAAEKLRRSLFGPLEKALGVEGDGDILGLVKQAAARIETQDGTTLGTVGALRSALVAVLDPVTPGRTVSTETDNDASLIALAAGHRASVAILSARVLEAERQLAHAREETEATKASTKAWKEKALFEAGKNGKPWNTN